MSDFPAGCQQLPAFSREGPPGPPHGAALSLEGMNHPKGLGEAEGGVVRVLDSDFWTWSEGGETLRPLTSWHSAPLHPQLALLTQTNPSVAPQGTWAWRLMKMEMPPLWVMCASDFISVLQRPSTISHLSCLVPFSSQCPLVDLPHPGT